MHFGAEGGKKNFQESFFAYHSGFCTETINFAIRKVALVVQWIELRFPKPSIRVRFPARVHLPQTSFPGPRPALVPEKAHLHFYLSDTCQPDLTRSRAKTHPYVGKTINKSFIYKNKGFIFTAKSFGFKNKTFIYSFRQQKKDFRNGCAQEPVRSDTKNAGLQHDAQTGVQPILSDICLFVKQARHP